MSVGSQASVEAAQATANTALAATIAAGSDGILSRGEKPGIVIDYATATENHTMLLAKAMSCGLAYADFSVAYGALRDYLTGLSPAYSDTTADTPINAASWAAVWNAWGSAYTSMLVRIASAAPSTVDAISTANHALTGNASAPVVDGVTMTDGKVVMLAAQTTKTQNGIYRAIYTPPAAAAYNVLPTASTPSAPLAYDITSGTTPNDATYAEISSGNSEGDYVEVVFSGFSGSNLTGDLTIKIAPTTGESAGMPHVSSSVQVQVSRDGGANYSTAAFYSDTLVMQTVTVPVSGATGSLLRVKVRATSAAWWGYDDNLEYVLLGVLGATARVFSVYLAIPASGSADWSFSRQASIPNASVWRSRAGTTYGPGVHYLATVDSYGDVTLTTQEAPYEAPLGRPGSGSAFFKRNSSGVSSWEARRFGFPDYASGATRAVTTVYQAATDGWLSLVLVGSYLNDIYVYVGSTNNPATLIWRSGDDINVNTKYSSGLLPIPAGTYYKIVSGTYPYESTTLRWFPALT